MNRISESDIERLREALKVDVSDPLTAQQWIQRLKPDLEALLNDATDRFAAQGGEFAGKLRASLEDRIVAEINGRVTLTPQVAEHSLVVSVARDAVWVDVRLRLGTAR